MATAMLTQTQIPVRHQCEFTRPVFAERQDESVILVEFRCICGCAVKVDYLLPRRPRQTSNN